MAKTITERQAHYRKQHPFAGDNGERRLNTWITTSASLGLERLARRYGVTRRALLEQLITEADDKEYAKLDVCSPEWDVYSGVTQ